MRAELSGVSDAGWALATLVLLMLPIAGAAGLGAYFGVWSWAAFCAGALAAYALFFGFGYVLGVRGARWRLKGRPLPREAVFPEATVVAAMAVSAMLLIGDRTGVAVALSMPLWGLPFVGIFAGGSLGELAGKRGVGLGGALGAVWRLHRQARAAGWAAAVEGQGRC